MITFKNFLILQTKEGNRRWCGQACKSLKFWDNHWKSKRNCPRQSLRSRWIKQALQIQTLRAALNSLKRRSKPRYHKRSQYQTQDGSISRTSSKSSMRKLVKRPTRLLSSRFSRRRSTRSRQGQQRNSVLMTPNMLAEFSMMLKTTTGSSQSVVLFKMSPNG